jgi:phenylacetate-CoA ligase
LRLYEPLFRHVLFPFYESVLRRRKTLAYLAEYEQSQWLSPDAIGALQWSGLKRLIDHCWREVPFYRRQWKALGITPSDLRSLADYERLPILDKAGIRENFDDLHAQSWRGRMMYKATGGSTGEPLRFGYTRESYERRLAVMWRGYGWAGARMGRRTLFLWGGAVGNPAWPERTKEHLYHRAFNRRMLDVFRMSESGMHEIVDAMRRYRPEVIVGYAGPLYELAAWMQRTGQRVTKPESILSAAEALEDFQRETIENVFGCTVYNTYGCREFMLIASQCDLCGKLHVNADHLLVELTGMTAHGSAEETGEVTVTDLHNWGMPLLRYRNGDVATRAPNPAGRACSRGLPTLRRIDGRKLDMLRTRDGRMLPGEYFPHLLKDIPGIMRFQVIQEHLDAFTLKIVPGEAFGADQENVIRDELAKVLGGDTALDIQRVDDIPLTPGGKRRVTISRLP